MSSLFGKMLNAALLLAGSVLLTRSRSPEPAAALTYIWQPATGFSSITVANPDVTLTNTWNARDFNYIHHSPSAADSQRYRSYRALIGRPPTWKNHEAYLELAGSLRELGKTADAERMFLTVLRSRKNYHTTANYHSSTSVGRTTHTYGYGSHDKHYAAISLTEIYLEQKKFAAALYFLNQAVEKYEATIWCLNSPSQQQEAYTGLYVACYAGLHQSRKVLDLLLPAGLNAPDELLLQTIRQTYSPAAIRQQLRAAPGSIRCELDTFPSVSYTATYRGTSTELVVTDSSTYYAGSATIQLFGRRIAMPLPELKNGEHLTKARFVDLFTKSAFHTHLKAGS